MAKGPYDNLINLGLTAYEARTYVAILKHANGKARVIAADAGIPQPHIYRVLRRLLELGFVVRSSAGRTTYKAVAPSLVLAKLKERAETRRAEEDASFAAAREILGTIYAQGTQPALAEGTVEIVKNAHDIFARLARMYETARRRLFSFNKPPYVEREGPRVALEEFFAPALAALARGVEVKSLFEKGGSLPPPEQMRFLTERGEELRVVGRVPMKLFVADGREVLMALEHPPNASATTTYLALNHRALGETLESFFERLWAEGTPIEL